MVEEIMDQTPTPSSTITADSSLSSQPHSPHLPSASPNNNNHILEITLISAQDLSPVCKSLRTYALTWVNPNRKRTTRVDNHGHNNPNWNDKFSFRVDDEFLSSDSSAIHVEIYTVSWFRDILVGTVKVIINNLVNPFENTSNQSKKFVALQIRRPSGNPQGILNMGVALIDKSKRSMPLFSEITPLSLDHRDILDRKINDINAQDEMINNNHNHTDEKLQITNKIQMWQQSHNVAYSEINNNGEFPNQAGSIINGSELCSDIGPSASIVAAETAAKKLQPSNRENEDGESSILEELTAEEAYGKGLEETKRAKEGHTRRNTDGGLYSCFGNAYCFEFTIVCGAGNNQGNRRVNSSTGKSRMKTNSA
ncbi:hypothetical protein AABB24_012286 [Solanum stoloniferum]|uniref:C2 domain-containing protein n=1 Tax=Solanum stoloniferum TaxID=62892 RepID=A0ABD2U2K2_9SOLN|nr:uncharacterized protein LOC125824414 [Solanum verrucosum]